MDNMKDIKSKFNTLQNNVTQLNNKKIGLESEIKTIENDQKELTEKLLTLTEKKSIEEAFQFYKEKNIELENRKAELSQELEKFLELDTNTEFSI